MKVKVSKVMAKAITKALKEKKIGFEECVVDEMTEGGYILNVAGSMGVFDAQDNGDYNWETGMYKFIRVTYPYEYYACPAYFTTERLLKLWRSCTQKTLEAFMDKVCEEIYI